MPVANAGEIAVDQCLFDRPKATRAHVADARKVAVVVGDNAILVDEMANQGDVDTSGLRREGCVPERKSLVQSVVKSINSP